LKTIKFSSPLKGYVAEPKPSLQFIPETFKKMPGLLKNKEVYSTVKKCIPFLDAFTTGYIIPFQTDIDYIYDKKIDECRFDLNLAIPNEFLEYLKVEEHHSLQISKELRNPRATIDIVLKFSNSWTIKTPPGYSCIFVTPFNHPLPFELVTGVVDTDLYELPINFPFYWTADPKKDHVLKQGTPMAMVIPFKREDWKIELSNVSDNEKNKLNLKRLGYFSKVFDNYKSKFWTKKSYK